MTVSPLVVCPRCGRPVVSATWPTHRDRDCPYSFPNWLRRFGRKKAN